MGWFANLFPSHTWVGKALHSKNHGHGIHIGKLLTGDLKQLTKLPDAIGSYSAANKRDKAAKAAAMRATQARPPVRQQMSTVSKTVAGVKSNNSNNDSSKTWLYLGGAAILSKILKLW